MGCAATMRANDVGQGAVCSPQCRGTSGNSPWRRKLRLVRIAVLVALLTGAAIIWYSGVFDSRLDELLESSADSLPKDGRPALVATKYASRQLPPNDPLRLRLLLAAASIEQKWSRKNPLAYSDPLYPIRLSSVQDLLDQLMKET